MKSLSLLPLFIGLCLFCTGVSHSSADELAVGGYSFKFSEPLATKDTPSPMVKGVVVIPTVEGKAGLEAKFYYFGPGQGGGIDANVARWIGQFKGEPKVKKEESAHGDRKVVILEAKGTYLDGRPFGPKEPREGYALLGAIIEGGEAPVFVKLVGAEEEVEAAAAAFKALVLSPFAKE